jgi:quercetin dioxygenase-like cupin family protein
MSSNPMTNLQQPLDVLAGKLKRTELQHKASSIPGREIVQVRIEIPAGGESGWHLHLGEEVGYILAGTVEMMIQGQPVLLLHAGDGFLISLRTPHNALERGPEMWQSLSTFTHSQPATPVALDMGMKVVRSHYHVTQEAV